MNNIVYKATNLVNGKIYIGQTHFSLNERRSHHMYSALRKVKKGRVTQPFREAIAKYGLENFFWEILKENLSNEEANYWEPFYIKEFNSFEVGYNATTGGKCNWKHTEETKQLIAEKASSISKEMWEKEGHRENMTKKTTISWEDEGVRKQRTEAIKMVRSTDEQRKLSSVDSKKRYKNIEARDKMAQVKGVKLFKVIKDKNVVGEWRNYAQCAKDLNFKSKAHIGRCLRGLEKSYCGFTFVFSEIK